MDAVIFTGLQGAGKSSFFRERFFSPHVRISLDLLRTRHRERRFLVTCLETEQRYVIDNTNPTREDRARYIDIARQSAFRVEGYYFQSKVEDCLRRNESRDGSVPDVAILSTAKKLEIPSLDEGFDDLFYVRLTDNGFVLEDWNDEV
jgi:predicted kinase